MKWWTHESDLSKSPPMEAIIAELGMAGYGRANVLLEVLARESLNDGSCEFRLPLSPPTDIRFWSRRFLDSVEETEQTFDVFERAAFINPWRETQVICAPMLGDRVDEWTKRKNKARATVAKRRNQKQNQHENRNENKNEHKHLHKHNSRAPRELLVSERETANPALSCADLETDRVRKLAAELKELGGQAFSGKELAGLGQLLGDFTAEQLTRAWGEFICEMDDFQLRSANRNFIDGGARVVIEARRIAAEKRAEWDKARLQGEKAA